MATYDPQRVINIALNEVGYLEKKSNSNLDSKTANAGRNNWTKYGRDMHAIYPQVMDVGAAWCAAFVCWCFQKAYGVSNAKGLLGGNFDDYTVACAQLYKNKNAYHKRGTCTPKPGWQIFFTNGTRICHTGLVYKVANGVVYTVEGNTSAGSQVIPNGGAVCKKSYALTNSRIDGYGAPLYGGKKYGATSTAKKTTATASSSVPKPTLRTGSSGDSVVKLQTCLNKIVNTNLNKDGAFGAKTKAALEKFQSKYGLKVDGIYGQKSYEKLKSLIK